MTAVQPRLPRVQFEHPVRVAALDGPPRIIRTLTSNLSRQGAFVRLDEALGQGMRVALSVEAAGRAFPLVEGSVRWYRPRQPPLPGGFGMRFERFLHPRGGELVTSLVESLSLGLPLRPARPERRWLKLGLWGLGAAALSAGATAGVLAWQAPPPAWVPPRSVAVTGVLGAGVEAVGAPAAGPEAPAPAPPEPAPASPGPAIPVALAVPGPEAPPPPTPGAEAPAVVRPVPARPPGPPPAARHAGHPPGGPSPVLASAAPEPGDRVASPRLAGTRGEFPLPSGAARALAWTEAAGALRLEPVLRLGQVRRQFLLAGPPRVVFDLDGAAPTGSHSAPGSGPYVRRVRVGAQGHGTRVVVDLTRAPRRATEAGGAMVLDF